MLWDLLLNLVQSKKVDPTCKNPSLFLFVASLTFKGYCTIQTSLRKALLSPLPTLNFQPTAVCQHVCGAHIHQLQVNLKLNHLKKTKFGI